MLLQPKRIKAVDCRPAKHCSFSDIASLALVGFTLLCKRLLIEFLGSMEQGWLYIGN